MTDWDRLTDYIFNYFPEPKYSRQDIKDWAMDNVPAWKYMKNRDRKGVLDDWEDFVAPIVEGEIASKSPRFWARIKRFLRGLF